MDKVQFFQTSSGRCPFLGCGGDVPAVSAQYANQKNQRGICPRRFVLQRAAFLLHASEISSAAKAAIPARTPRRTASPIRRPAARTLSASSVAKTRLQSSGQKCIAGRCVNLSNNAGAPVLRAHRSKQPTARNCSVPDRQRLRGRKCDLLNGHCVDKVADCNSDDRCGASCKRLLGDL